MPALSSYTKDQIIEMLMPKIKRMGEEIDKLQKENEELKKELTTVYRKISHGCTDANCAMCDKELEQ